MKRREGPSQAPAGPRRLRDADPPFAAWLAAAAVLYGVLGALGAVTDPWRGDESFTFSLITRPLREMMWRIGRDVHPPLFYLLMAGWQRLWPAPDAMKALTLLFGLATVLLAGIIGRQLGGRRAGIAAALLFATFPQFLHTSQDARMYGLALLFEMIALEGWMLAVTRPRRGWLLFTGGLIAAIYTHNHCLVFAAAFIAAELVRCARAARTNSSVAGAAQNPPRWRWVLTSALAMALAYAPWLPTLLVQMRFPWLATTYHTLRWPETLRGIFFYPYALRPPAWGNALAWVLAPLLLLALPAIGVIARRSASGSAAPLRPRWMIAAITMAPLAFLWGYSRWRQPVLTLDRQGVLLFAPLLILAACGLSSLADWLRLRVGIGYIVAVLGLNACLVLSAPRDPSIYGPAIQIMDKAPPGAPIFPSHASFDLYHLDWLPLPLAVVASPDAIPDHLTSCTLLVTPGAGAARESVKSQAEILMGCASNVDCIYSSYDLSAYVLRGLPDGAARRYLVAPSDAAELLWPELIGPRAVARSWNPRELAQRGAGKMRTRSLGLEQPEGLQLMTEHPAWNLDLPEAEPRSYFAVCLGFDGLGLNAPGRLTMQLGSAAPGSFRIAPGRFAIAGLVDPAAQGAGAALKVGLSLPPGALSGGDASPGAPPSGLYLLGACVVPIRAADLQRAGRAGTFIDVGTPGDELFLRSSFFEREGVPSDNYRWTQRAFELEVPVFDGAPAHRVTLWGFLPREIPDRKLELTIDAGTGVRPAPAIAAASQYGAVTFALPAPLAPGIHRLRVQLGGVFVPADHSRSSDRRELGFNLDGVGIE